MTNSKTNANKKTIIAVVSAIVVLILCLTVGFTLNQPTASGTRQTGPEVEVYGIGDDDVGFIIDGQIFPTRNQSYAKDGIVHTDGYIPFTYDGKTYTGYFSSDVTQGTGTYTVTFNLNDALNDGTTVHPENSPEDCTFSVVLYTEAE